MKALAVIPARYASTRFPGKPLEKLAGKPIIQHVFETANNSGLFEKTIVATDDERIFNAVRAFNGMVEYTDITHQSGSDRVAEVAIRNKSDLIINIQGDEPFISETVLKKLLAVFTDKDVQVASLMHKISNQADIENPNIVKVVTDSKNDALYFSRAPIPFPRDDNSEWQAFQHLGVYAFRKKALLQFVKLEKSDLENVEKLEQLRLLENGYSIRMVETQYDGFGIDTPEDLKKAEIIFKNKT